MCHHDFQSTHLSNKMVRCQQPEPVSPITDKEDSLTDYTYKLSSCKSLCLLSTSVFDSSQMLCFSLATRYLSTSNLKQVALVMFLKASPFPSSSFTELPLRDLLLCSCYYYQACRIIVIFCPFTKELNL